MLIATSAVTQNVHNFFIEDTYQRSYFNPALNNKGKISVASGLGADFITNGPGISDFIIDGPDGNPIISAASAIPEMNEKNDIYGYGSVNTIDVSFKIPLLIRVSVGHAWKINGWLQYPKNLAEFVTFGNGPFVGETLELAPQIEYITYNEIYLGLQKSFGPVSVGARIKSLNGVEAIRTRENSSIKLTTSDDIYQLTLESDYELSSSKAFSYTSLDDFDLAVENFSFDNFLSNNGGWAFDLGAAVSLGDRIEVSLGIIDIGSINWNVDPKVYTSQKSQQFDGIDVTNFINTEDELILTDSLKSLLDVNETTGEFSTTLPTQVYLGGRFKISDLWTVGAIIQSVGSGERRANTLGLNAMANIYTWLSVGGLYTAKTGNAANIGLSTAVRFGPVTGFLSSDNIFQIGSVTGSNSNLRAGVSVQL